MFNDCFFFFLFVTIGDEKRNCLLILSKQLVGQEKEREETRIGDGEEWSTESKMNRPDIKGHLLLNFRFHVMDGIFLLGSSPTSAFVNIYIILRKKDQQAANNSCACAVGAGQINDKDERLHK